MVSLFTFQLYLSLSLPFFLILYFLTLYLSFFLLVLLLSVFLTNSVTLTMSDSVLLSLAPSLPPSLAAAPSLQRLRGVGSGPELQHGLGRDAAQPAARGALAAGHLQHLPAAVRPVPAEHGLHPRAGPTPVPRAQVRTGEVGTRRGGGG